MTLTRAAFAVMINLEGLTDDLKELVELTSASSFGEDTDLLENETILDCWSNATKMRYWLIMKK